MLIVGSWTKPAIIIFFLNICAMKWSSAGILDWGRASNKIEINIPWLPFENETRCYDELGCINITRDWYHLIYRPLNVFPLPRQVIDTRFILYTRKNPNLGQMLKVQSERSIQKSNFDAKKQTKIIIHGFIDTPLASWVKEMRREFLKHADWNVIVVDWAGGSLPLYTQATANTRLVGLEVAYFVNYLKDNHGLNPKDVHIVGHSLGAHTAGYAGERINKLGRITGLDPAEPYFQGMSDHVRLDASDADLVDVIHTDASSIVLLGYGMSDPVGHIDFYPNNGKEQPGCDLTETPLPLTLIKEGIEEASRVLVACNHVRAIKLFTESINSRCPYIAHRCPTYQHFLQGKCFTCEENNTSCAMMGLKINANDLVPGFKYFTTTGKEPPFCRRHYKVTLDLARPPRAETWVQGFMKVTLHSDNGVIRNLDLTPNARCTHYQSADIHGGVFGENCILGVDWTRTFAHSIFTRLTHQHAIELFMADGYEKLEHGTSRSFVVAHPEDIGHIRRIEFYWEYDMDVLQPRSICFLWCNDHLYVASIRVTETKDITARDKRQIETNSKLCSTGLKEYADIASRTSAVFVDDCDDDLL